MTQTDAGAFSADTTAEPEAPRDVTRRSLLRGVTVGGAALPLLAACGGGDESASSGGSGGAEASAGSSSSGGSSSGSGGSGGSGGASGTTVAKADVPVGGGTILKKEKLVVVQPTEGDFKAFSAVCTHQGCTVGSIEGDTIVCPCHKSHFAIKDGSNTQGPNGTPAGSVQPLAEKKVAVKGAQLSIS